MLKQMAKTLMIRAWKRAKLLKASELNHENSHFSSADIETETFSSVIWLCFKGGDPQFDFWLLKSTKLWAKKSSLKMQEKTRLLKKGIVGTCAKQAIVICGQVPSFNLLISKFYLTPCRWILNYNLDIVTPKQTQASTFSLFPVFVLNLSVYIKVNSLYLKKKKNLMTLYMLIRSRPHYFFELLIISQWRSKIPP